MKDSLRQRAVQSGTLLRLFLLFVLLNLLFGAVMLIWDFGIIDELYRADEISAHVAAMTRVQRRVHMVMTATLDVAYPLSYGALFAGVSWKAFPHWPVLALPILLCIPVDVFEGLAQLFILSGSDPWIAVKTIVTPIKLVLFAAGALIAVASALRLFLQRKKARTEGPSL